MMLPFSAPDDLQNPEKIRSLLKDIREARQAKSREGLPKLDHNELLVGHFKTKLSETHCTVLLTDNVFDLSH